MIDERSGVASAGATSIMTTALAAEAGRRPAPPGRLDG
jgi:hypothetical protein